MALSGVGNRDEQMKRQPRMAHHSGSLSYPTHLIVPWSQRQDDSGIVLWRDAMQAYAFAPVVKTACRSSADTCAIVTLVRRAEQSNEAASKVASGAR